MTDITPVRKAQKDSSLRLFLGLYLLLLAFFVFLFNISRIEESRSKAVIDSLRKAFPVSLSHLGPEPYSLNIGIGRDDGDAVGLVAELLREGLPLAALDVLEPGHRMEMRVSARDLFLPGTAEINPGLQPMIERLAALLAAPQNARTELEAVMAISRPRTLLTRRAQTVTASEDDRDLAIRRAGALVRALRTAGSPPEALSAGLDYGDPNQVRLRFAVRARDAARIDFTRLGG